MTRSIFTPEKLAYFVDGLLMGIKIANECETVLKIMQRANNTTDDVTVEIDAGIKILLALTAELRGAALESNG